MSQISLSVFFPAYNEANNIKKTVEQAHAVLKKVAKHYEIIIINDGSKDNTGEIIDTLAKKDPEHVRAIHHNPNQGYGAALKSGFDAARYDYVFFSDSDLQFDLNELTKLIQFIPEYEAVIGYRAPRRDPFFRLVNAKVWNIANRMAFGLKVKDIDCAFKLFKRDLVKDIPMHSRGAMLSAELLIRLQRNNIKLKEVPVTHLPSNKTETTGAKPTVIIRALKELYNGYRGDLGKPAHKQLIKFTIVGAINTLFDILLYVILTRTVPYFGEHQVLTKAITFALLSLSGFFANRAWTFKMQTAPTWREFTKFFLSAGSGLLVNTVAAFVLLKIFHPYDIVAVIGATGFSYIWNFTFQKFWVFKPKPTVKPQRINKIDALLLGGIILATLINAVVWLRIDTMPPHWDMANHVRHSLEYTDVFQKIIDSNNFRDFAKSSYEFLIGKETYYPPFTYWISVPTIYAFGRTFMAAVLSNVFFAVIITFSTYTIGVRLWNRTTGLLAALVMMTFPFIVGQFHEFQLDMPLTAMTTFSIMALLKSERWQNRLWSFIFGVACGFGMLTKWPLPAFVIGPFIYELVGRAREIYMLPKVDKRAALIGLIQNLGLSLAGLIIIAGPWYGRHINSLQKNLGINWETGTGEGDPSPLTVRSLRLYSDVLIQAQIRLFMLIPLLIGIVTTFMRKENLKKNGILLAWFIGSYIIMTIYNNKDYRFIEPVLGSLAILTVFWIPQLIKPAKNIAIAYIIVVAVFHFLTVSWGQRWFPNTPEIAYAYIPDIQDVVHNKFRLTIYQFGGYGSASPREENWRQDDIIELINNDNPQRKPISFAMYYEDEAFFNRENFAYTIQKQKLPYKIRDGGNATWDCYNMEYVIATTKNGNDEFVKKEFPHREGFRLKDPGTYHENPFCTLDEMATYTLPNGQGVYLWKVNLLRPKPAPGQP